jgi:hypothetical protein
LILIFKYSFFSKPYLVVNSIWWLNSTIKIKGYIKNKYLNFFMKVKQKNINGDSNIFIKRRTIKVLYPFKLWILLFQNWLIIIWFFFKPEISSLSFKKKFYFNNDFISNIKKKHLNINYFKSLSLVYNF